MRTTKNASPPLQLGEDGSVAALPTIVFLIGLVVIGTLMARKVKGALLIGIIGTTIVAIVLQAIFKVPTSVDSPTGWNLNAPGLPSAFFALPDLSLVGHADVFGRSPASARRRVDARLHARVHELLRRHGTMTGLAKAAGSRSRTGPSRA